MALRPKTVPTPSATTPAPPTIHGTGERCSTVAGAGGALAGGGGEPEFAAAGGALAGGATTAGATGADSGAACSAGMGTETRPFAGTLTLVEYGRCPGADTSTSTSPGSTGVAVPESSGERSTPLRRICKPGTAASLGTSIVSQAKRGSRRFARACAVFMRSTWFDVSASEAASRNMAQLLAVRLVFS